MFKKNIIWGIILGSTAFSAVAENDFSGEILLGTADQEVSAGGVSASGDDISFGVRGAFSLSENFAIEGAYQSYGEADDTYIDSFGDTINDKLTTTALNIGVKGIVPLDNGVSLNGRLGISFWDAELKETDSAFPGQTFKADDDGNDLYYGIGIQYKINSQIFIGAEYTITKMDISTNGVSADLDVNNISLSLGFKL